MKKIKLVLATTSNCQRNCPQCTAKCWMLNNPNYHMSLYDLQRLVSILQKSKYLVDPLIISGGEPLLWCNLIEGLELLRGMGKDNIRKIVLFTNALYGKVPEEIIPLIDVIRVSAYNSNVGSIKSLKRQISSYKFPGKKSSVVVKGKKEFYVWPEDPVECELPVRCACGGEFALFNGRVYPCMNILHIEQYYDVSAPSVSLKPGFANLIEYYCGNMEACKYCIANMDIRNQLTTVVNQG